MKRRLLAVLVAISIGIGSASGLTVWTTFVGPTLTYLEEDVAAFADAFGVDAEVVSLDVGEIERRMLLTAPEGEAADVLVGVPHDYTTDMAAAGVLADLSPYATPSYLDDLSERARLAFVHDGRLLGLPQFVEGPALLYNRALLPEVPATYEDLVDEAAARTEGDRYGFLFDIDNFYFNFAWLNTHGGYVFGREAGTLLEEDVGLASEGAIRGAEALRALRFDRRLIPAGMDYDRSHRLFVRGSVAALYTGPWVIDAAREAGIDVGIAPMPPLADGTPWSGFMSVQGVVVNEFTGARTDAVNLAKWIAREEAQEAYARRFRRVPASTSALERVAGDEVVAGFGRALLASEPIPNVPRMGRVWGAMARAMEVVLSEGDANVGGALEAAVREIRAD